MTTRKDGRGAAALRPIEITQGLQRNPEGSVLYRCGGTTVLVSASCDEGAPDFRGAAKLGWATAEYAMHPRANPRRQNRDGRSGRVDGRTQEIQRLIGRALRSAIAFERLGDRTITVDCDVLDADGGTRTASITGGLVALAQAVFTLQRRGLVPSGVLREPIAAISVGLLRGVPMVDLDYEEDRDAEVDLNVVATATGGIVEVQGTAEGAPIPRAALDAMVDLACASMPSLVEHQLRALTRAGVPVERVFAKLP